MTRWKASEYNLHIVIQVIPFVLQPLHHVGHVDKSQLCVVVHRCHYLKRVLLVVQFDLSFLARQQADGLSAFGGRLIDIADGNLW